MDFKSEHVTNDNGAKLELATVIHEGREYTHFGSIVDENRGLIIGYPSKDEKSLLTWDGQVICPLRRISSWKSRIPSSYFFVDMTAYSCEYGKRKYSGRGQGAETILRLRAR